MSWSRNGLSILERGRLAQNTPYVIQATYDIFISLGRSWRAIRLFVREFPASLLWSVELAGTLCFGGLTRFDGAFATPAIRHERHLSTLKKNPRFSNLGYLIPFTTVDILL